MIDEARSIAVDPTVWWQRYQQGERPVDTIAIGSLGRGDSPRLDGENDLHVQALVESEATLPPIIVHRSSMRVIDGHHRLRAAILRAEEHIGATFFDGDGDAAFVLAVIANAAHGLPLSAADRRDAARRIIAVHPQWSDRKVAALAGMSPKTVASCRSCSTEETPQLNTRIGRDGRARPVDSAERRRTAGALLVANPDASLREVAKVAGISPATVRSVRQQLRNSGEGQQLPRPRTASPAERTQAEPSLSETERMNLIRRLRADPSLRFTEDGRLLLRLFDAHLSVVRQWSRIADNLPAHCRGSVLELVGDCARMWGGMVSRLADEQRSEPEQGGREVMGL